MTLLVASWAGIRYELSDDRPIAELHRRQRQQDRHPAAINARRQPASG
jgi:hypothetical protein